MKEVWKSIEGYEGYYEVSNLGRVRSLKRKGYKNGTLKQGSSHTQYWVVVLCKDGKRITKLVHRLVAKAFIPNPDNKPQVNHIDSNRKNNRVDNLEWVTPKENSQHAYDSGSRVVTEKMLKRCSEMGKQFGRKNIQAVNEPNQRKVVMMKDGKVIKQFDSLTEGAKYVGKNYPGGVWACCNGKFPTYMGYVWEYADADRTMKLIGENE